MYVYHIMTHKEETKVKINLGVDPELYDKIAKQAKDENRSIANMVVTLLKDYYQL